MRENCAKAHHFCDCVDRRDIDALLYHMLTNFVSEGFSLDYHTLEPEEERMLCHVGRCSTCGKRLCHSIDLPNDSTPDELLGEIYHWMYQINQLRALEETYDFRKTFLSVFHEEDRGFVAEWLEKHRREEEST